MISKRNTQKLISKSYKEKEPIAHKSIVQRQKKHSNFLIGEKRKLLLNRSNSNPNINTNEIDCTTKEENNENNSNNNLISVNTPKRKKIKIPFSISHTANNKMSYQKDKHHQIIKVIHLDDENKKQKDRDSSIKDKNNSNLLLPLNKKLTHFANNYSSNKISQKLLSKTPFEFLMKISTNKQDDEYFNYEEEKAIELTKEEKDIFGNREMKNYQKIKLLGKGGCGIVWLSLSNANQFECAVKQICKKNLSYLSPYLSPTNNQIAKNEIEIMKILNSNKDNKCPSIVDFYDSYEDQNDIWFAFEKGGKCLTSLAFKIKGDFLKNERIYKIKKGQFIKLLFSDISQFKKLIRELLKALDFINSHGIIHADIKPENILIDYIEPSNEETFKISRIKVIDYGSAFYANNPCAISSNTPEYLCPELTEIMEGKSRNKKIFLADLKNFISCVDIWSLGVTILELVVCCPVWMSYKAKVSINGKNIIKTGIFGVKGRDGNKINNKQMELARNLHKILSQSMIYIFSDKDKREFEDLLSKMLNPRYKERITPKEALMHNFLIEEN